MSGGIDSTACVHLLREKGLPVRGVFIDFGQVAAKPEQRAAEAIAANLGVPLTIYRVCGGIRYSSGELPGRNAFLLFTTLFLTRQRSGLVAIGVHAGTPYYDCSSIFIEAMTRLAAEQTDGRVAIIAPFLSWTKGDVFRYFTAAGLPLGLTYSCEAGAEPPCGECASCQDRRALGC
jgi:7-cyano-7-deazaguanine synthase